MIFQELQKKDLTIQDPSMRETHQILNTRELNFIKDICEYQHLLHT